MKSKQRLDPIASLVRCVKCGYPLRMEEFFSPEDNRVCADYWSPVEPKKMLPFCPQCDTSLSKLTVELWTETAKIPDGAAAAILARLAQLPPADRAMFFDLVNRFLEG